MCKQIFSVCLISNKLRPVVSGQLSSVLHSPVKPEISRMVSGTVSGVVVGEQDAAEDQSSTGPQLRDLRNRSHGEEREEHITSGFCLSEASVGADVFQHEVTKDEGTVGQEGHATCFLPRQLPVPDLVAVNTASEECPGDLRTSWALRR